MLNNIHKSRKTGALWLSMTMSALLPMALGYLMAAFFSGWRWSNYPFHAMLESVGAISALTIASLMISLIRNGHLARHYIVAACALVGMGILDGFHSVLHAGGSFIWLHSIATMVGGVMFAAIWISEPWLTERRQRLLLISTVLVSLIAGIVSITLPDILPTMIIDGQFSLLAIFINIVGGVGFLLGTFYFIYHYLIAIKEPDTQGVRSENLVFANHCLLFGIAGLLFETSVLWDAGWWWWHILRFAAYLVVLIYFFSLMRKGQEQLKISESNLDTLNKELEQRVQDRTHQLEIASKAKSEFLSRMSHELRTPLNAILGFGQLMEIETKPPLSDPQADNLREIMVAGYHLLDLVNEVLDLGRIESGRLELNLVTVDLAPLIDSCVSQIKSLAAARNISIEMKIDNSFTVLADEMRCKQIVINLLSNAIKFNHEGGDIKLYSTQVHPEWIRISIEDTGTGIDADSLPRLFRPFERLVSSHDGIEGSGIGLALAKQLANAMQGELGVESVIGEGSTFWFELPVSNQVVTRGG